MVFAANSGTTIDGRVLLARFRFPQRRGEEPAYAAWFAAHGFGQVVLPRFVNEGEGDFAVLGDRVLAGYGFRTDRRAHAELASVLGREVLSLRLVDPRFYHLDTALAVLAERDGHADVMYFPEAFSLASRRRLRELFPDALLVGERDALAFGLNAASDGRHVVLAAGATSLARQLQLRGYEPVPVDVSELLKAGGGVKCCTLELRPSKPVLGKEA
jgi:N-dimethylarginine dimethylaminohydrolase